MIRYLSVAAMIAVGATVAFAQAKGGAEAITERKAAMKTVAGANKALNDIAKGDAPFDAAKVAAAYKSMSDAFAKSKTLYPDDSKTGDTAALPAIWEKKADFQAKLDKAVADAKATAAAVTDVASLKAKHAEFTKSCGACHRDYRAPPKK
jgi:cytochrome c556